MGWLRRLRARIRYRHFDAELREELDVHRAMKEADLLDRGASTTDARIGASRASTVTYLIPVFGVAWAWLLLGESLTWTMAISAALILGSVAMSQQPSR